MIRRSRVPCGRSNLLSVFFIPMASTYTPGDVEGQGVWNPPAEFFESRSNSLVACRPRHSFNVACAVVPERFLNPQNRCHDLHIETRINPLRAVPGRIIG